MTRSDQRSPLVLAAAVAAAALAGCSGSGSTAIAPVVQPTASSPASTTTSAGTAGKVTLTVTVPGRATAPASNVRHAKSSRNPSYISSGTADIEISMPSPNSSGNQSAPVVEQITPGSGACASPAESPAVSTHSYQCTFTLTEPVGTDTFLIAAYDAAPSGTSHVIAQQQVTAAVSVGDSPLSVVLDAIPNDFILTAPTAGGINLRGSCDANNAATNIDSTSTGPCSAFFATESEKDLPIALLDVDGQTIPAGAPGYPSVTVTSSNPSAVTASVSGDESNIKLTPLVAGSSTITVTETSTTPGTDGITKKATSSFTIVAAELYVTTGNGILVFPQPIGSASVATIGSAATPNLFGIAFDTPNAATGKLYATNNSAGPGGELLEYGAPSFSGASLNTETFSAPATVAGFTYPNGIAFDKSGNIYVSDNGTGDVDASTTPAFTTESQITGYAAPTKLAFDATGNLYVPDFTKNTITVYATGFTPPFNVQPTAAQTIALPNNSNPNQVAFDAAGDMFVVESGANQIAVFNAPTASGATFANTTTNGSAPSSTIATGTQPTGMSFDPSGNLYVAAFSAGTVTEFAPTSNHAYTNVGAVTGLTNPDGVVIH